MSGGEGREDGSRAEIPGPGTEEGEAALSRGPGWVLQTLPDWKLLNQNVYNVAPACYSFCNLNLRPAKAARKKQCRLPCYCGRARRPKNKQTNKQKNRTPVSRKRSVLAVVRPSSFLRENSSAGFKDSGYQPVLHSFQSHLVWVR